MRILLLNTSFPPQARSAARLFYELGTCLVRRGHRVSVITEYPWRRLGWKLKNASIPRREYMDGMYVVRVRACSYSESNILGRGLNLLLIPFLLYRAARSVGEHDIVLVYSPPLTLGLVSWMLKRRFGTPFVFNVQDIYPQTAIDLGYLQNPTLIRGFEWLERFVYRQADRLVVHSEGNKRYLTSRGRVEAAKVSTIPNWVNTDRIRPANRLNAFRVRHHIAKQFIVCYAGTMGYAQDLTPIIAAAGKLREHENILFLLVGEGVRAEEWRRMTKGLSNVRFLPLLPEAEYDSLVSACDVGYVPLADDLRTPVVPAKLLDFMAAARPVISTVNPNSDTATIINTAKCGFVFPPSDPAGVVEAILFLEGKPDIAEAQGRNGRKYAEAHFSLQMCSARYEQLFMKLLSGTTGVRVEKESSPASLPEHFS
jgi:putative colanic acid biosynthesis glycosyltransferase WcaI